MAFQGQPHTLESLRSSGGGEAQEVLLNSVLCSCKAKLPKHTSCKANSNFDLSMNMSNEQILSWTMSNARAAWDELWAYQALEYSGGLGEGAAYRPPYSQDELTDEGCYERPQHMRSYASVVMQPMLPAWAEYAQYAHPVDEALLQRLERTLEQYDGLVATQQKAAAVSKGKGKIVPTLSDESDYGESSSEHEWESEEGESAAQRWHVNLYDVEVGPVLGHHWLVRERSVIGDDRLPVHPGSRHY
ncbi:hypothetical protein C0995_012523 [Termitomyces sp. Mi166|nr:hypothetical protein C0995_012523 [Termitomyces sp. Mi166\